jgi:hypothetical protein
VYPAPTTTMCGVELITCFSHRRRMNRRRLSGYLVEHETTATRSL